MVVESIAILAISLVMIVVFFRAQRIDYALSITPIMAVPFVHLVALGVCKFTDKIYPGISYRVITSFADIAALAVSCLLLFFFSLKIKSKKNKNLYLVVLCGYNIILTCAYVYNMISPLFI